MNKIQAKRFKKLIDFLEELDDEKFYFGSVVSKFETVKGKRCGSVCCAIGWTPVVFPKQVAWIEDMVRVKNYIEIIGYIDVASYLFGMSFSDADNLFSPFGQKYLEPPVTVCGNYCTPKDFAKTMKEYLKLHHPNHYEILY